MRNVTFLGISGNVTLDMEGDRIADYALLDQTNPESGLFEVFAGTLNGKLQIAFLGGIALLWGHQNV